MCCRFSGGHGLESCGQFTKTTRDLKTPTSRNSPVSTWLVTVSRRKASGDLWRRQGRVIPVDKKRKLCFKSSCSASSFMLFFSGCRRDKDGYYWITGRIDDMLNVSGTDQTIHIHQCSHTERTSFWVVVCRRDYRAPDEHSGGGGGADGAPRGGRGCGGEPASSGEGRVSVLLCHAQGQHRVQSHSGRGAQETG